MMIQENESNSRHGEGGVLPRLRFPDFRNAPPWEEKRLGDVLDYEQPTKYLVESTDYSDNYQIPVLTAGKTFILGYTKEIHGIYKDNLPTIIFDDFTTAFKYVNFPFKAKSSAMKMLNIKNEKDSLKFVYEIMTQLKFKVGDHKRYWITEFSNLEIPIPHPDEQLKIADCLTSLDEVITAQTQAVDALKTHKTGLMQQLFPKEGETVPRLRFAEFTGEWEEKSLKQICEMQAGKFIPATSIKENQVINSYPCYGGNGLRGYTEEYTHIGQYTLIGRQGAWCGNVNFAQNKFYATEHAIVVTPKNKIDTKWLFYELGRLNLNRLATGQAQPGLSVETLKSIHSFVPIIDEQQKIADCLTSLDEVITAQTAKLEALKAHKQALMQQLFPTLNKETA